MTHRNAVLGLIAADAIAYVGGGALLTVAVAGMLPYGHPRPSAEAVLAVYAAKFVLAPAVLILALGKIALHFEDRRGKDAAVVLSALPMVLWPMFLFEPIK